MSKAFTRFRMPWHWNGGPALLQSRAWDDQGYFQPTRAAFIAERGVLDAVPSVLAFKNHHINTITSWAVDPLGMVRHAYA
jgi:sulfane dehydrogenase subunit SoxC